MSASQALHRAAVAAVDAVLPLAGASAVYADHPIQRCSRDLHAASQHILFNVDVLTDIGQVALGRTPTAPLSDLTRRPANPMRMVVRRQEQCALSTN